MKNSCGSSSSCERALEHPERIPDNYEQLGGARGFGDGTNERFMRRVWREMYPTEPVPGPEGEEEFRDDLRRTITGEITETTATTWQYVMLCDGDLDILVDKARRTWQRFYPDEPLPG